MSNIMNGISPEERRWNKACEEFVKIADKRDERLKRQQKERARKTASGCRFWE